MSLGLLFVFIVVFLALELLTLVAGWGWDLLRRGELSEVCRRLLPPRPPGPLLFWEETFGVGLLKKKIII